MESCPRPSVVHLSTDPSFASGEIVFMAYGAMGIGPLENPPQTDPFFALGEIGFMAYGAMGIRTPDLLNAINFLQLPQHADFTS